MNNRCKIQLVVSRYNENLDWLCAINDVKNAIIKQTILFTLLDI